MAVYFNIITSAVLLRAHVTGFSVLRTLGGFMFGERAYLLI